MGIIIDVYYLTPEQLLFATRANALYYYNFWDYIIGQKLIDLVYIIIMQFHITQRMMSSRENNNII